MDKSELLSKIEAKIQVSGRSSLYNPLLQKPVRLNPIGPGSYAGGFGGYAYIGPPPDFGGSYGAYQDAKGRKQVGVKSSKMFSIFDGSPTALVSELKEEERDALVSQLEAALEEHKCPHCLSELCISVASPEFDSEVYCPHCGSPMESALEKVKTCVSKLSQKNENIEGSTVMSTKVSKDIAKDASKMEPPKDTVQKPDFKPEATQLLKPVNAAADVAKEAMKVEPPKDTVQNPDYKPEKIEINDQSEAQKQATEVKPMDELQKAPKKVKSETEDAAEKAKEEADKKAKEEEEKAKAEKAKSDADEEAKKSKLQAAVERYKMRRRRIARAKVASKFDGEMRSKLVKELRIMSCMDPKQFEEVCKNPKLAEICEEVKAKVLPKEERAQIRAELKSLAEEDGEAAEEAKKQLEFVAPEITMEDPEFKMEPVAKEGEPDAKAEGEVAELTDEEKAKAVEEGAKVEEKPEAEMTEEEKAKKLAETAMDPMAVAAPVEMAEAMKTEFLASIDSLKGEKIEMSIYGEDQKDPFWNLTVDGEPVARIHLQDQKDADSIRSGFVTDSYATNFGDAIDKVGLKKMLTLANARMFAHKVDEAEVTARLRDKVKAEMKSETEEKLSTLRSDFLNAVSLAMVATNKNIYQDENRHALKGGLFNALVQAGLSNEHAVWAIEAGFESSPQFFNFVMDKAVEIMDMPKEARESLAKTLLSAGTQQISVEAPEEDELVNRLVKSSVNAIAMGGMASGENRDEIRKQMGFKSTRR